MHSPSFTSTNSQRPSGTQNSSALPGVQQSSARASSPVPPRSPAPARPTEAQSHADLRKEPVAWQQQRQPPQHRHAWSSPSHGSGVPFATPSNSRPAHFPRFQGMVSATDGGTEELSNTRMSFQHPPLREDGRPLPFTAEVPSQSPQRRHIDSSTRGMDRGKATKRRRAPQACMRCRGQKLRCDGQQPCGRCIAQGAECKFDGGQRGVGLGNAVELNTPHQRQNVGGPMGIPGSSASGFREGVVGSMPSSPSGGALALAMDHGYFPGSSSSSPVLSRTPPQPMYPPPAAALSSFTPGAVSQPQFVAHGRAATTIPALTQTQGHPRSTHFSGPYGPAPSIPAESPSSTTSHPRFQPGTSSSGPNSWHDRHGGRMAPPPSTQAFSSYPPTNTISQSQSWPNVGTVGSSMASSRSIPPPGNMTHPATTPFEHEILARLTRVENALHELGQDVQGILSSMSSHPRHPRQNPSYSVSPPSTAVHGAERLAAAERIGHGTSPQIQASTHLSPRLRHEGAHVDLRNISRTPQGAPPPHIHPSGPSALRGPSPVPSTLRGGHVRPRTSGSGTDERVQIPPRTSSTMFGSRGSPGFAPGQQSSETRVGQGQYSDEYPRSALPVGLESVPERPSSWSGPREERGLERERGSERDPGQMREIAEQGALTKPRTPPELPTVSAIDAWRSGSRGRQRATTDVGSTASPSNSLHQAQLFPAPIRAVHHQSQQQPGQQQRQPQHQLHQQQYPHQHQHQHQHHIEEHPQPQHEEQSHQLQHARPSDDRPMHGDDGDRGVKRRRLSEESD